MAKYLVTIVFVTCIFNVDAFSTKRLIFRDLPKDFRIILEGEGKFKYTGEQLAISFNNNYIIVGTNKMAKVGGIDTILSINKNDSLFNVIKIVKPIFEIRFNVSQYHQSAGVFLNSNPRKEISVHVKDLTKKEDSLNPIELIDAVFCHSKSSDSLINEYHVNNKNVNDVFDNIRKTVSPGDMIFVDHIEILLKGELYKEDGEYFAYFFK